MLDVCAQIRDQYLKYPGISRAALAMVPPTLTAPSVNERMLAILLAGGIEPQTAAWAIDTLLLYVSAYALEISLVALRQAHQDDDWVLSRDELMRRFTALPADEFPQTTRYAAELTSGAGHERFDFTLSLIVDNLAQRRPTTPAPAMSHQQADASGAEPAGYGRPSDVRLPRWVRPTCSAAGGCSSPARRRSRARSCSRPCISRTCCGSPSRNQGTLTSIALNAGTAMPYTPAAGVIFASFGGRSQFPCARSDAPPRVTWEPADGDGACSASARAGERWPSRRATRAGPAPLLISSRLRVPPANPTAHADNRTSRVACTATARNRAPGPSIRSNMIIPYSIGRALSAGAPISGVLSEVSRVWMLTPSTPAASRLNSASGTHRADANVSVTPCAPPHAANRSR